MTSLPTPQVDWGTDHSTLRLGRLKVPEVLEVLARTQLLRGEWCSEVCLDLSDIDSAFSAQALPLVVAAQDLGKRGVSVKLTLPERPNLRQLFLNTNWAHLIAPTQFGPTAFGGHHIAATEYESPEDQQRLINAVMDLLLEQSHIDRPVLGALEWSLNEVTDNVLTHAGGVSGIMQVTLYEHAAHIVVADTGRGIGSSMRDAFPELADDVEATRRALLPGVTSGPGQGNGLAGIDSIARLALGELNLISGFAFGRISYETPEAARWEPVAGGVRFPGTVVTFNLPLNIHLDLREALRFQSPDWEPWDFIDSRYELDAGTYRLLLAEERRGVSSRAAGRAMRTKAENLLSTDPSATLDIDFAGLRMIASSFADEFVGRLRLKLGDDEFERRIRLVGLIPETATVLSGAVSQRLRGG